MSSLQQLIDRRRAEASPEAQPCHAIDAQLVALVAVTSAAERWVFPWHQLVVAQFTSANGRDQLALTFPSHQVTIAGRALVGFCDLIARGQLATVRPAPTKYAKGSDGTPFVDALHVTPRTEPAAG